MSDIKARIQTEIAELEKSYGKRTAALGSTRFHFNVVPTGIMALDYALGTGGWMRGHPIEVFGPPDIGKSSAIGLTAIASAQKAGLTTGLIALEPGFDMNWAIKNGVDPEMLLVVRPSNGEQAFDILYRWVIDDLIDFIVFDSIGAVVTQAELAEDKEIKSKVGGQSKLITDGVKRILGPTYKNNKGLLFLNQVRDQIGSHIPGLKESPGGWALKHSAAVRVELKKSGTAMKAKVADEDKPIVIGQTLVAIVVRNKLAEGTQRRAEFDYYQMETEEQPVGVDIAKDVIATGMRTGVIKKAGNWYSHHSFPGEGRLQGKPAVGEFLHENPKALAAIHREVLEVMQERRAKKKKTKPELEVVEGG